MKRIFTQAWYITLCAWLDHNNFEEIIAFYKIWFYFISFEMLKPTICAALMYDVLKIY